MTSGVRRHRPIAWDRSAASHLNAGGCPMRCVQAMQRRDFAVACRLNRPYRPRMGFPCVCSVLVSGFLHTSPHGYDLASDWRFLLPGPQGTPTPRESKQVRLEGTARFVRIPPCVLGTHGCARSGSSPTTRWRHPSRVGHESGQWPDGGGLANPLDKET